MGRLWGHEYYGDLLKERRVFGGCLRTQKVLEDGKALDDPKPSPTCKHRFPEGSNHLMDALGALGRCPGW